jgi:anaerobic selenocysteine-containing dehydrogenase
VPALRHRRPEPQAYVHPDDAARLGIAEGDPVCVEGRHGAIQLLAAIRPDMPTGVVRVPHGWWKPEQPRGRQVLSGAWHHADALLCADDDDFLDREQGTPHFKGLPCRIVPIQTDERHTQDETTHR